MRSNEGLGTPGGGGWPEWLPFPPPENVQRIPDHRSRPPRPKKWIGAIKHAGYSTFNSPGLKTIKTNL